MLPYFQDENNWATFKQIALSQVGVKFQHACMIKDRAFDCSTFIGWCLLEAKLIKEVKYEFYQSTWYVCNPMLMYETIKNHLYSNLVEGLEIKEISIEEEPMRGDIALIYTYRKGIPNHAALILDNNEFIHCRWHGGVEVGQYNLSWARDKTTNLYRIMRS